MIYLRWVTARANDPESMTLSWLGPNDSRLTSLRVPFAKPVDQGGVRCPIVNSSFWSFLKLSFNLTHGSSIVNLDKSSGAGVWYQSAKVMIVDSVLADLIYLDRYFF